MHLSSKPRLYCPYKDCVRSSEEGFTRKENLQEHLRRRHSDDTQLSGSTMKRRASSPPFEQQRSPAGPHADPMDIVSMSPASDRMPSLRHKTSDASLASSVHSDVTEYDSQGPMSRRIVTKTDTYAQAHDAKALRERLRCVAKCLDSALYTLHLAGMSKRHYKCSFLDNDASPLPSYVAGDENVEVDNAILVTELLRVEKRAEEWDHSSAKVLSSTWEEHWQR